MLRLKLDGARLDKLLCLGQAALSDGNIHAGCFDSVTINNGVVDLFPLFRGWFSFHRVPGLSQFSMCNSRRFSVSCLMSLMSVNWAQRVTSQFLRAPSISTTNFPQAPVCRSIFSRKCCFANVCRLPLPALCSQSHNVPRIVTGAFPGDEFR